MNGGSTNGQSVHDNRPLTAMDNPAVLRVRFVAELVKVPLFYFAMNRFLPANFFVPLT